MRWTNSLGMGLAGAIGLACSGCGDAGDGLPRQPVSGAVTINGRPLAKGMVTFSPLNGGEAIASAVVRDGRYEVARADGPVPGPHRVSVWGKESTGRRIPDPDDRQTLVDELRDVVPESYGLHSSLTAQVAAGGSNNHDFTLTGTPSPPRKARPTRRGMARR